MAEQSEGVRDRVVVVDDVVSIVEVRDLLVLENDDEE